jgi:hypothetical protein
MFDWKLKFLLNMLHNTFHKYILLHDSPRYLYTHLYVKTRLEMDFDVLYAPFNTRLVSATCATRIDEQPVKLVATDEIHFFAADSQVLAITIELSRLTIASTFATSGPALTRGTAAQVVFVRNNNGTTTRLSR